MPMVQADRLTRIGAALLRAAGASDEEASAVAAGIIASNSGSARATPAPRRTVRRDRCLRVMKVMVSSV